MERWINNASYLKEQRPDKLDRIGTKRTEQLASIGIESIEDLATADPTNIADATGKTQDYGKKLRDRAAARPGKPTTEVDQIGSERAEKLAREGIETIADLAAADPDEIAPEVEGMGRAFFEKRIEMA